MVWTNIYPGKEWASHQIDVAYYVQNGATLNDVQVYVYKTVEDNGAYYVVGSPIGEGHPISSEVDSSGITWTTIALTGTNGNPLHIEKDNPENEQSETLAFLIQHDYSQTGESYLFLSGGTTYPLGEVVGYRSCGIYWQSCVYYRDSQADTLFKTYVDTSDTDADGITDDIDGCPNDPGPADNNGCPLNTAPEITPLRPAPSSTITDRTPNIVAKVTDAQTELGKRNITLALDGTRVPRSTFSYDAVRDRLTYTPASALSYGRHTVKIAAVDSVGLSTTKQWRFRIVRP